MNHSEKLFVTAVYFSLISFFIRTMTIKTRLTENDYIRVNFYLLYRRWFIRIITAFAVLTVLFSLTEMISHIGITNLDFSTFIFPIVALAGLPLLTLYGAKRNYKTASRIHETITYDFRPDYLDVKGESFTSQMAWAKFYKVTKSKNWLLIWQNRQAANIIPIRDVWESQVEELKEILQRNKVKNNL